MENQESPPVLTYLINHVFLPSKLPLKDDSKSEYDFALLARLKRGLTEFQESHPGDVWMRLVNMVARMETIRNASGGLIEENLVKTLEEMQDGGK